MDTPQIPPQVRHKTSKVKLWLAVILVAIGIVTGGFVWIRLMYRENQDAKKVLNLHQQVVDELSRCKALVAQPQGNFKDYDYCQQLITTFPLN